MVLPLKLPVHRGVSDKGTSLSPFPFILTIEGQGRVVKNMVQSEEIKGLSLHIGGDKITYQKFVDDTMLMGHPSVQEVRDFMKGLTMFSKS